MLNSLCSKLRCCRSRKKPPPELSEAELFFEPPLPVICQLDDKEELHEGACFTITGETKPEFNSLFVYLECREDEMPAFKTHALLVNPRPALKLFLGNTKIRTVWGEERQFPNKHDPLKAGAPFTLQILVTEECFLVAANGFHISDYPHRVPFKWVRRVLVKGDVEKATVERAEVTHYPTRQPESLPGELPLEGEFKVLVADCACGQLKPSKEEKSFGDCQKMKWPRLEMPTPHYALIPAKHFSTGRALKLDGQFLDTTERLQVSLQQGHDVWPQPRIVFLLTICFCLHRPESSDDSVMDYAIGTSYDGAAWRVEPPTALKTHPQLRRGKRFRLYIVNGKDAFEVFSNGAQVMKFAHGVPQDLMDTVLVQGDFKLLGVALQAEYKNQKILDFAHA